MKLLVCDFCKGPIAQLDPITLQPTPANDKSSLFTSTQHISAQSEFGAITLEFNFCSPLCTVGFNGYFTECWGNPKYETVPIDQRLEAFMNGELVPDSIKKDREDDDSDDPTG